MLLALGGLSMLAHFDGSSDPLFLTDEGRLVQFVTVIQLALVDLWRAYGVEPNAVMGVSNGEPAAVYAAGGLSLADTIRVSMSWALISQVESPLYGVILLKADYLRASELCAGCPVGLFIAVDVAPNRQPLYCALADMDAAKVYLRAQGASFQQVKTSPTWPYHTPVLIQHEAVLRKPLEGITPRPTTKPCYLTTFGRVLPTGTLLPWEYWLRPPQEPVHQYSTLKAAIDDRYFVMTSLSAYPFSYAGRDVQKQMLGKIRFTAFFAADKPELETFATLHQQLLKIGLAPK